MPIPFAHMSPHVPGNTNPQTHTQPPQLRHATEQRTLSRGSPATRTTSTSTYHTTMSPNQGPIAEPAEDIFNGNIDNYSDNLDFLTGDAYPEDDADLLEALLPLCEASPSPKKNKNINVYHNHKKICLRRSQSADVGQSKDTGQSADMGAVAISDDELIDQLTAEQTALSTAMAAMFHTTTTTSKMLGSGCEGALTAKRGEWDALEARIAVLKGRVEKKKKLEEFATEERLKREAQEASYHLGVCPVSGVNTGSASPPAAACAMSSNSVLGLDATFPVRIPCRARNVVPVASPHTPSTGFFHLPSLPSHGAELMCSHVDCIGFKFAWCATCRTPVAKRNLNKRHNHGRAHMLFESTLRQEGKESKESKGSKESKESTRREESAGARGVSHGEMCDSAGGGYAEESLDGRASL